eukprot:TRINITY_DN68578_c0_g1_i1.p1 TRINITY_DN68578_c0_g1~~TRINITY_DN68578_c0_g1_i1.p1  ORF type:complete len:329 (-),score=49.69 TRINITY_DN68578_c0_g1_i1:212-1198(-)
MATRKMQHPPLDCISRVRFASQARSTSLLVSSWDAHLRLYDASSGALVGLRKQNSAVLDCSFLRDASCGVGAGLDGRVFCWDFSTNQELLLGVHDQAVRCVEFDASMQWVVTGSWDKTMRLWDPRQAGRAVRNINVGTKVFSLDVGVNRVVLAGSDRHVQIFDSRRLDSPMEKRESPLKHQLRAVKIGVDQRSFASASVEGRVSIEYFDAEENQRSKYAFKCHREKTAAGDEIVHPVNALAFHPVHGTFGTGGSDGGVCVWDGNAKKRLWRWNPFETGVSSLSFSADGAMLAIGVSYTLDQGEKTPAPVPELVIRHISDAEVLPKPVL